MPGCGGIGVVARDSVVVWIDNDARTLMMVLVEVSVIVMVKLLSLSAVAVARNAIRR